MILNIFIKVLLFLCALFILFVMGLTINHKYQLHKEAIAYPAPGKLVNINDRKIHVYGEGQGEKSFVFMSGHGTVCPTIDFKPLWMRLNNEHRIIVVEKAGYGWSQVSKSSREIELMLKETREALKLAGEEGPYILVPHSMSGLEAIYWAQTYPQEVEAIIGLDPTVPDFVEHSLEVPNKIQLLFMYFISRIGLSRFMPQSDLEKNLPLLRSNDLSSEDTEQCLALFYKSAYTKNMLAEIDYLPDNAKKVKTKGIPVDTPMYFFISDGKEVIGGKWRELLFNYVRQVNNGKYMYLDTGHYVHYEKADIIAKEIKNFIE